MVEISLAHDSGYGKCSRVCFIGRAEEQLTNGFLDTPVECAPPGMSKHMRLKDFPSFIRSTDPDEFVVHSLRH